MIIAIDVGNSNVVIGTLEGRKVLTSARVLTKRDSTAYEYAMDVKSALEFNNVKIEEAEGAIIASVVPSVTEALRLALKLIGVKRVLVVGSGIKTGLNIKIDDPAQLGADLAVGAVAGLALEKAPMILIDMGTATTITAIAPDNSFIGGAIIPGVVLSMNALANGTSLLPNVPIKAPGKSIGTNTVECMQSGAVVGAACMLDGMIDRFEAEIGQPCSIIATGGLSRAVVPLCRHDNIRLEPDLLLIGLAEIWEKNRKTR